MTRAHLAETTLLSMTVAVKVARGELPPKRGVPRQRYAEAYHDLCAIWMDLDLGEEMKVFREEKSEGKESH